MVLKFRAWYKSEKKMKRVYSIGFNEQGEAISIQDEFADNYEAYAMYDVSDYELMQSTGIKDKNGVEIYEGDIIHHAEKPNPFFNSPFEIIQARTGEWILDNYQGGTVLAFSQPEELEVIGNIYENPELLEES
ncbi:YopX family protein [Staphylococcus warneri]|uniref:YopX family protein n=1 Tax=Staphylococcus warneri TaxID=1292 RepID=UPI0034CF63C7